MRVWNIGIVGGGPGGLMTAYALQRLADRPFRLTLYEASSRLGGKILTPQFSSASVRYEAGAAEFYDYSMFDEDPLRELVAELGLPVSTMGGPAVVMNERILSNLDDIRDQLGAETCAAVFEFDQQARNLMTPLEFYNADEPEGAEPPPASHCFDTLLANMPTAEARQYVHYLIHSDLATEPSQTSRAYGLQNYLMNDLSYMRLYGIDGGNERLPQELAARIAGNIMLEQPVRSVARQSDGRLRVTSTNGAAPREDDFDYVIMALPHSHLDSVEYVGPQLSEALRRHHAYYDYPAHYLRMTLLFKEPFWRDAFSDSYWMLDQFGGCCLYDESSRDTECGHGVLGWLLGGASAVDLNDRADEELIELALESLPSFMAHGRSCFVEGRVHRWCGAVSAMPGGVAARKLDERHQPEPREHANLFVVGDYLYDSTLNGVLDSADYVAAWIAALMTDSSESSR